MTTRNKSITSKAMQYRQHIHAHMLLYVSGVIYSVSSNYIRSIWHNSAADFLRFGKFPPQICESRGTTYRYNYETFSDL